MPAVLANGLLAFSLVSATELSDIELHGKQIYLSGTTPSGASIMAILGTDQIELPSSAAPCGSCHGIDGRGRPEGGVVPSDITWSELAKGYGHEHVFDRRHPAFDDASLAVSIIGGKDPAGNDLDIAMPRYRMEQQDIDALIAYIKRIETDLGRGLSEDSVRVGTLLPLSGPAASQGQAVQAVLAAFVRELNDGGGVNGRRIELEIIPLGKSPAETLAKVQGMLESSGWFAMVAAYIMKADSQLAASLTTAEVPIIGPITRTPATGVERLRYAYYLYAGNSELHRSLAQFAASEGSNEQRRQVVIGADSELLREVSRNFPVSAHRSAVEIVYSENDFDAAEMAAQLGESDDVFFLGAADELDQFIDALAKSRAWPRVFLTADTVGPDLLNAPVEFDGRIFVAYPTRPGDVSASGRELFARLAANAELSSLHVASQVSALASARILVEAMQRAGHALSHERLIAELEGMHGYETGLTPPISFDLNRHVGARGAHIMRLDLAAGLLVPAAAWTNLPQGSAR